MGSTRYGKKVLDWEELSADQLFEKLSDYLLQSGFADDWSAGEFSIDELREAILRAMSEQAILPVEEVERLMAMGAERQSSEVSELVDRLIRRMMEEGLIGLPSLEGETGQAHEELPGELRFELTDRAVDFLGFRSLRDTLGRAGRHGLGRHETTELSTGVEATEAPKPYEFGDTLNLDPAATVLAAVQRAGLGSGIDIEEPDLRVRQSEHRVSSATVLLLDCSHSMVLYGEDRFTPAKRVALGLSHLIRTQYPGDELRLVLFHDSAEEIALGRLPRVRIGPWHTNTAAGLALARRLLARSRKDLKTIIMITDGKPSALTLPDGRIYKNSFGLDPVVLEATFREVAACRRSGIQITTFMLARDAALVAFVKKVSEMCRGKAYFTTPLTLGRYVTMDFMTRKVETVN